MILRQIGPDRAREMDMIDSVAFTYPLSDPKPHDNATNVSEQESHLERFAMEDERTGKLMGGMLLIDYQTRIGNRWLPLSGIGGVSTLPEYRRMGVIRGIFERVLPRMYEKGYALSGLYPFSHAFYRKFGYETMSGIRQYTVGLEQLRAFPMPDEIRPIDNPRDELSARGVYELFSKQRDASIRRELSSQWKDILGGDIHKDCVYKYLLMRRANGKQEPCAYIVFTPEKEKDMNTFTIAVREAAFIDPDGLYRLLGFASTFYPHYRHIRMILPGDIDLGLICPDPYDVELRVNYDYMLRAINAKVLLESMPLSPTLSALSEYKSSSFTLLLHDELIPQNEGLYVIRAKKSGVTCEKALVGSADLEMGIGTFTQLVMGSIALPEALSRPDFRIHSFSPAAQMLFIRRPQYIVDRY